MYRTSFDLAPDPRAATLRWLTVFALIGYPVGAALELGFANVGLSNDLFGSVLRFGAIIMALVVLVSRLQKVASGQGKKLDEFELSHRRSALERAYPAFTVVVVFSLLYLGVATHNDWWVPTTIRHWNVVSYYFALLAALLPTTVLVWSKTSATLEAGDAEGE